MTIKKIKKEDKNLVVNNRTDKSTKDKTVVLTLKQIIQNFIGYEGRIVSGSKSCGPACAIYNSNMVINDEVIWYGDLDLDKSKNILCAIANLFGVEIKIYHECDVRVFDFEVKNKKELRSKWKKRISESNPVYSTNLPNLIGNEGFYEYKEKMESLREDNIKRRQIMFGFLTPTGKEWTWYNKLFFFSIYRIYQKIYYFYENIIKFSYECAIMKVYSEIEEGIDSGIFKGIIYFYENIIREIKLYIQYKRKN